MTLVVFADPAPCWFLTTASHLFDAKRGYETKETIVHGGVKVKHGFHELVRYYRRVMGAVDRFDRSMALYHPKRRTARWYMRVDEYRKQAAVVNAWNYYRRLGKEEMEEECKTKLHFTEALA